MKKHNKTMYILGGLALAAIVGLAVFNQGKQFQGYTVFNFKPSAGTTSGIALPPAPPTLTVLQTSNTYVGTNQPLIKFRVSTSTSPINIVKWTTANTPNFHLQTTKNSLTNVDFNNCKLKYSNLTALPLASSAGTGYASRFNIDNLTIPANSSMDFTMSCDVTGAKGDIIQATLWRIDYNNTATTVGSILSNNDPYNMWRGPAIVIP